MDANMGSFIGEAFKVRECKDKDFGFRVYSLGAFLDKLKSSLRVRVLQV